VDRVHEVLIDGDVPTGKVEKCERDDTFADPEADLNELFITDCKYLSEQYNLDEDATFCEGVAEEMLALVNDPTWNAEAEAAEDPADFYYDTLLEVMGVGG
nr:hypothetical protein [Acidimicrobiia bacterium]